MTEITESTDANLRELDARLLVRWCGWRWMRHLVHRRCMLWPPPNAKPGEWEPTPNFESAEGEPRYVETLSSAPPMIERFSDWHKSCCRTSVGWSDHIECGMPHLSRSLDACGMLKASLVASGIDVQVHCGNAFENHGEWIMVKMVDPIAGATLSAARVSAEQYSTAAEALAICRAADSIPEGP